MTRSDHCPQFTQRSRSKKLRTPHHCSARRDSHHVSLQVNNPLCVTSLHLSVRLSAEDKRFPYERRKEERKLGRKKRQTDRRRYRKEAYFGTLFPNNSRNFISEKQISKISNIEDISIYIYIERETDRRTGRIITEICCYVAELFP